MAEFARRQLKGKVLVEGKPAQFISPGDPLTCLGLEITRTLDWKPQLTKMSDKLTKNLTNLACSFATPRQTMDIVRTAIIPSIAYAFPVTPCSENDLAYWDKLTQKTIKERYKLRQCTATAILREDKINFGLGCTSIAV
eukprot:1137690-Pelagomonas_calceolata.AAC.3